MDIYDLEDRIRQLERTNQQLSNANSIFLDVSQAYHEAEERLDRVRKYCNEFKNDYAVLLDVLDLAGN